MSEKELSKYLSDLDELKKEVLSSKEKSIESLVAAGIIDEKGDLAPQYAGE